MRVEPGRYQHDYSSEQVAVTKTDWMLIQRLLCYLRPYRVVIMMAILFLLISKAIEAAVPIMIGKAAQQVFGAFEGGEQQVQGLWDAVSTVCFTALGLLVVSYFLDSLNIVAKSWIGQRGLFTLRTEVYSHVLRLPMAYFDKTTMGRLMTRTIHDVDQINQMFSECVIPIIGNALLFVSMFIGIAIIDWRIACMVAAILPFVWWLTHRFRSFQKRCYERIRTVVAAMNTFIQENLMGAATIRSFGLQAKTKKQFEEINEDTCSAYVDSVHHFAFFMSGIDFLQSVSLILAFAVIVAFAPADVPFNPGVFFTFSLYALMFFRPLADLAERYNVLQSAMAAAGRIFTLLDTPTEDIGGTVELDLIESIHFDDVWFAYENEHWVLRGLSLHISRGKSYAVVGLTGAGKSTLMNLLLRYYEPKKGRILINGRDIRDYSLASLRNQFSIVLQDPVIFSGTIEENIALFDPATTRNTVEQVVNYLGISPFIHRFPEGLDRNLQGKGFGLSVGEMQLISLARAIAHRRSVMILDEATASIDMFTEQLLQQAIAKAMKSETALVIAHRLSTIKDVSEIIVLQNGRVAETGTHLTLLERGGIYEKLYRLQFLP